MTGPIACGSGFGHRRGEGAASAVGDACGMAAAPLCGCCTLILDAAGVGLPVVDLFKAAGIAPVAVGITGGSSVRQADQSFHVPKRELIRTAVALPPRAAFGVLQVSRIWRTLLRNS